MSNPYGYSPLMTRCVECGKEVDLFEARKWMAQGPKNIDDPAYCEDCYYKALCDECGKEVKFSVQVFCSCSKYGFPSHDDVVWCSQDCLSKSHDGYEYDDDEKEI